MSTHLYNPMTKKWVEVFSHIMIAGLLLLILLKGLLGGLIAGFAIYLCTQSLAKKLPRIDGDLSRQFALFLIIGVFIALITLVSMWIASFLSGHGSGPGLSALMTKMAEILNELRKILPAWASTWIPESAHNVNSLMGDLLKAHADKLQTASQDIAKSISRMVIGMIIGGMAAIMGTNKKAHNGARILGEALKTRLMHFNRVFGQVVVAQLKISLINTFFTGVFLGVVLPLTGNSIPFTKTLILLTFIVGLIPVLGNLISNTVITIMALSVSIWVAAAALVFLIVIHKVEYFLNARIIGGQINARAWELLLAMILMEACFGLSGVIAAPIFYAYYKYELRQKRLI